jgi:ketosteroid isomerase-like protein
VHHDAQQEVEMGDETRDAIERFHDALNGHDIDALAGLVHEQCVFETTDPPDGTRHEGRAAVLEACREFFVQSPEARFEMEEVVTLDDRALVRWRYAWADGHVRGVDVMRVRDGQIIETFAYVKG